MAKSNFLRLYETNVTTKLIAPELRMLQLIALSVIMVYWIVRLLTLHELFVIEAASGSYTVWLSETGATTTALCTDLLASDAAAGVNALEGCLDLDSVASEDDAEACNKLAELGAPFIAGTPGCEEFDLALHARTSHEEVFLVTNAGTANFTCDPKVLDGCLRPVPNPSYPARRSPSLDPFARWRLVAGTEEALVNLFYSFASFSKGTAYMRDVEPRFETAAGDFLEFEDFVDEATAEHFREYGVLSLTLTQLRTLANVSLDDVVFNATVGAVPHRVVGSNLRVDVYATNMLLWNVGENKQVTVRVTRHDQQPGYMHPEVRWDDAAMRSGEVEVLYGTRIQAAISGDFYVFDPGFRVLVIVMATDTMIQLATVIVDIIAMAFCTAPFKRRFLKLKHYKAPTFSELTATPRAGARSPRNLKRMLSSTAAGGAGGLGGGGGGGGGDEEDCLGALSRRRAENKEEPADGGAGVGAGVSIALAASATSSANSSRIAQVERRMQGMHNAMKTAFARIEQQMLLAQAGGVGPTQQSSPEPAGSGVGVGSGSGGGGGGGADRTAVGMGVDRPPGLPRPAASQEGGASPSPHQVNPAVGRRRIARLRVGQSRASARAQVQAAPLKTPRGSRAVL